MSKALSTEVITGARSYRGAVPLELKLARQQVKIAEVQATKEIIKTLLEDPAFNILMAYIIVEILIKQHVVGGGIEEAVLMTAITSTVGLKSIAPILPDIIKAGGQGISEVISGLAKIAPALAAGA